MRVFHLGRELPGPGDIPTPPPDAPGAVVLTVSGEPTDSDYGRWGCALGVFLLHGGALRRTS